MLKKIILAAMLFAGTSAFAQDIPRLKTFDATVDKLVRQVHERKARDIKTLGYKKWKSLYERQFEGDLVYLEHRRKVGHWGFSASDIAEMRANELNDRARNLMIDMGMTCRERLSCD